MGRITVGVSSKNDGAPFVTPYGADITRTWVRNDIGTASVTFPLTTPRLAEIIAWGSIIRIYEYGLPTWVGVAVERQWSDGAVTLQLKSAEWLLQKKLTGQGLAFPTGISGGALAYGLFVSAYLKNCWLYNIQAGIFDGAKPRFKEPYNYADLYESLKKLAEEDDADFWIDDQLRLHYRNRRGSDLSVTVKLREGKHLTNVRVVEAVDDVLTAVVALGEGADVAHKTIIPLQVTAGVDFFRAEVLNVGGATTAEELRTAGTQVIRNRIQPIMTIDCEMVKVTSGEFWGAFFVGDTVQLVLTTYTGWPLYNARVLGVEVGGEDKMRLVLEVIPASANNYQLLAWAPTV